jgi:hypothetical protein
VLDGSDPDLPSGPLFESRGEALWYLGALTGSIASISAFFLAGAFWPGLSFGAAAAIVACGTPFIVALNLFLSKKTREVPFGRRWMAQVRLQQRLATKAAFEELLTVLGWNPYAARHVRGLVFGVPIVCWVLVFVRTLD